MQTLLILKRQGRSAPSILEDISLYDFQNLSPSGVNILQDAPIRWALRSSVAALLPADSCQHAFCTKANQSAPPPLDLRPGPGSVYRVAAVCRKCRIHFQLTVDHTARPGLSPCPVQDYPLHHLIHSPWREDVARKSDASTEESWPGETYVFECSSQTCSATVIIRLKEPRLSPDMVHVLTDQAMLKSRTEEAIKVGQGRLEGMKHPSSAEVMGDLRTYLRNAWIPDKSKPIRLDNKRFMLRFGPDGEACEDVLEYMGFTLEVSQPI